MLLWWELGQTSLVFFVLADKKRPIARIIPSCNEECGGVGIEDDHAGEVVAFIGDRKEKREPTLVLV